MEVSIIFVNYRSEKQLVEAVNSARSGVGDLKYEIVVVNNESSKKLNKKNFYGVRIIESNRNLGYGGGLNKGVAFARGEYLVLANPDILFSPNSINKMVKRLSKDTNIGLLGPQVLAANNTVIQTYSGKPTLLNTFFAFSFLNKLFPNNKYSKSYWLPNLNNSFEHFVRVIGGVCMVIPKKVFLEVGGFDDRFFLFFEETDISTRIAKLGYKILYYPKAQILHYVSQSMRDQSFVESKFEESRFRFYKKYYGLPESFVAEFLLRITKKENIVILGILMISAFLNFHNIGESMLFIGDSARDYLAARDMILQGRIPLVGIPSSVVWLHQGPLSIYLIGIAFAFSKFNPIAPAYLYGLIGLFSTYLVYRVGKNFFNSNIGLLTSLVYATSPLVLVNTRMPYHTSSIPFFTLLFFLILRKVLDGKRKYLFILFFILGLLLQVELSNGALIGVLVLLFLIFRPRRIIKKDIMLSFLGFIIGVLPFILYDIFNRFPYSIGFPLWVGNRVRLFFGLTTTDNSTVVNIPSAIFRIYQQSAGVISPFIIVFFVFIVLAAILVGLLNLRSYRNLKKEKSLLLLALWLAVPLLAFTVHTAPGTAYFPLLYPVLALLTVLVILNLFKKNKFSVIFLVLLAVINAGGTLYNNYFLSDRQAVRSLPPAGYIYGVNVELQIEVAKYIVSHASGNKIELKGGGFLSTLVTGTDSYKYLIWYYGGNLGENGHVYTIYEDKNSIKDHRRIIFNNNRLWVTYNETN